MRVWKIDVKNLPTRKFIKRLAEKFNHKGSGYYLRYDIIKKKKRRLKIIEYRVLEVRQVY